MNKGKFFEQQALHWGEKFKVSNLSVKCSNSKLKNYLGKVYWWYERNKRYSEILYNSMGINQCSKMEIIQIVLHELGHLIFIRSSKAWKREYEAEKFALEIIKKYLPQYYKQCIKNTKDYLSYRKKYKNHVKGFTKVLEEIGEL